MSHMSVSKKLVIGFALVALLGCFSSVFSVVYLDILNRDIEILSKEALPNITDLGEMRREVLTMRMALREMRNPLYSQAETEVQVQDYQKSQQEYFAAKARYESVPMGSEEKALWERLVKAESELFALNRGYVDYAVKHAGEKDMHDELLKLARQSGQTRAYDEFIALFNSQVAFIVKDNNRINETALRNSINGRVGALIAGALSLIMSLFIGFTLARAITRRVRNATSVLESSADYIRSSSEQLASASQSLASGSSEQAASIEEISSSLEEISSMTKQNADYAAQANKLTADAIGSIDAAHKAMQRSLAASQEIARASGETQKIIKTIDEIAFQTNLLSLNAAVESARAGDAGAGFAVVADEVRSLSMRSAEASRRTAQLIEETIGKVNEGVATFAETGKSIDEVVERSARVQHLVGEIAAASNEQSKGIEQINRGVSEMEKVVQQNAANSEETAASTEELNAQAEEMRASVRVLAAYVFGGSDGDQAAPVQPVAVRATSAPRQPSREKPPLVSPAPALPARPAAHSREFTPEQIIPLDEKDMQDF